MSPAADQAKATILVVDDEPADLNLMRDILQPQGYLVLCAADGQEALAMAAGRTPDLVLVDLLMPGMSGFEVIRSLKQAEATRSVPVVVVSGLPDVGDRVRALEAGADEYLTKPVHPAELTVRVRTILSARAHSALRREYEKRLEREVGEKTEALRKAYEELRWASLDTVFRLTRAAEYRDEDTGGHIQRISNYCMLIARRLGMGEEAIDCLTYASAMHDVGKIGIPDRILLKPGKLDAEEWETMKTHTIIGAEILRNPQAPYVKMGCLIALTHHERWDGKGYPAGLAGKAIALEGRITAIADVFDALTSKRPYKQPFGLEESLNIIRAGRELQFDPAVVDAFFAEQKQVVAIRQQFGDGGESWLRKTAVHELPT